MGISHLTKRPVTVQLDADWTAYTDALPQGSIALGIVTVDDLTGALVQIEATGEYVIIRPDRIHKLNRRKVQAAIHQAQQHTSPDLSAS